MKVNTDNASEFDCPFCLGKFFLNAKVDLPPEAEGVVTGDDAVIHSWPPCKLFVEKDVDEYLRLCRRELVPESFN